MARGVRQALTISVYASVRDVSNGFCSTEAQTGWLMGTSSRTTHAIEPGNGDLLMPERSLRPRTSRPRDVEDACFETIGAPGARFSRKPATAEIGGVFKSGLTGSLEQGPFPPDFACSDRTSRPASSSNGRLGVFSGKPSAHAGPRLQARPGSVRVRPDGGRLCRSSPLDYQHPGAGLAVRSACTGSDLRAGLGGWLVEVRGGTVDP